MPGDVGSGLNAHSLNRSISLPLIRLIDGAVEVSRWSVRLKGRLPMLACGESKRVQLCRLVDEWGRSLGWIVQPRQRSFVGPKAGTVLLRRELPAEFR